MSWRILQGDCIEQMKTLDEKSVQTCVTSPPYFGLRDYGHEGQIGLEPTPDEFVQALVEVFREVRRVLRDDGTVWLNLGDSYNARQKGSDEGWDKSRLTNPATVRKAQAASLRPRPPITGSKPKDLIGIPWMVAFALRSDGWYLRQDIIWHKPNPMPESVQDRCTKSHEYIFLLSKSQRYFYDAEAIKEPASYPEGPGNVGPQKYADAYRDGHEQMRTYAGVENIGPKETRNKRSVWTVTTKPFSGAHFATFPPDLIEPCILAGAAAKCCAECGAPWARERIRTDEPDATAKGSRFDAGKTGDRDGGDSTQEGERLRTIASEPAPSCECGAEARPSVVLDPFTGSGTTGIVALANGRDFVGCELNPEYADMASGRLKVTAELPDGVEFKDGERAERKRMKAAEAGQLDIFGEAAA